MKFKNILSSILVIIFAIGCVSLSGFTFFKKSKNEDKKQVIEQVQTTTNNKVWCVTFQLVWNDFMDKITNGKPVIFEGGNPPIANELNKKLYTKDILNENSYYITNGEMTTKLKKQIEKAIWEKFKEKSDILDMLNWGVKDSYLFYAMLKKNFNFLHEFDRYPNNTFNNSDVLVKYFGIKDKSDKVLYKNVKVLFYNSAEEYAVKLLTKEKEEVILYRTDKEDSFENLYAYIDGNTEAHSKFIKGDTLKVPDINVDELVSYSELCGKRVIGTNYIITQALQTIKLKMDTKGGSLKSEAAIAVMKTALLPETNKARHFMFDKPFYMFLKEESKDKPYYAMKVADTKYLVKE